MNMVELLLLRPYTEEGGASAAVKTACSYANNFYPNAKSIPKDWYIGDEFIPLRQTVLGVEET